MTDSQEEPLNNSLTESEPVEDTTAKDDGEIHSGVGVLDKTVKILDALGIRPVYAGPACGRHRSRSTDRTSFGYCTGTPPFRTARPAWPIRTRLPFRRTCRRSRRGSSADPPAGPILQTLLDRTASLRRFTAAKAISACASPLWNAPPACVIPFRWVPCCRWKPVPPPRFFWLGRIPTPSAQGLRHAKFTATKLAAVRKRGWSESVNEREEGVCSISAPIRNASGQVIAAISISGPTGRMGAAPGRRYAPLVMAAGKYLTEALVKAVR